MRALTVCQPYAHLIAIGEKPIENRTWRTDYRGPLLIHAGRSMDWLEPADIAAHPHMAFGAVVAIARLVWCLPIVKPCWPRPVADLRSNPHANGPWCWILSDVRRLRTPIPAKGARLLWTPGLQLIAACEREAA